MSIIKEIWENFPIFGLGVILGAILIALVASLSTHSLRQGYQALTGGQVISVSCHEDKNGCSLLTKFPNQETKWVWIPAPKER